MEIDFSAIILIAMGHINKNEIFIWFILLHMEWQIKIYVRKNSKGKECIYWNKELQKHS
jgi:hypothetical protein